MNPTQIVEPIVKHLEDAWNEMNGEKFSQPFAAQSDFINIRGMFLAKGTKEKVTEGHQSIFDSFYKDSKIKYDVADAELLNEQTILAHIRAELNVPQGPLTGTHNSIITIVVIQENNEWKIRAFHNTLVK
ncbi:MAG: SgcJ/EcaC family oxidoreductase [Ignavibacteria bacterium]|nr:SgcJ/EcaC family oxidoreductase [Ignavibacteria bacterium]